MSLQSARRPVVSIVLACLVVLGLAGLPGVVRHTEAGPEAGLLDAASEEFAPGQSDPIVSASNVGLDTSSRASVVAFYKSDYLTSDTSLTTNANAATCTKGTTTSTFKTTVLNRINYYRAMAGVPDALTMNSTYSGKAQSAAIMFSANGALDHTPPTTWRCYNAGAAEAAGASNISIGRNGSDSIDTFMRDRGTPDMGHRRWIIYPQTQDYGTGDVLASNAPGAFGGKANALWVKDANMRDPRPATRDGFIAWPPPGFIPYQVVFPYWSFSMKGASFSGATVSVTLGGTSVPLTITARGSGPTVIPENTISFRFNSQADGNQAWPNPGEDDVYTVRISGIVGAPQTSYTYKVTVIDPDRVVQTPTPLPTPECTITPTTAKVGGTITASCSKFVAGVTVGTYWTTVSSTALSTFVAASNGTGTTTFKVPSAAVGDYRVFFYATSNKQRAGVTLSVAASLTASVRSGVAGTPVTLQINGFQANEVVEIRFDGQVVQPTAPGTASGGVVITDSKGAARLGIVVPQKRPGRYTLRAVGANGSSSGLGFTVLSADGTAPTATATATVSPPTATRVPPTPTSTTVPPTETSVPPTATATNTPVPPPPTETPVPTATPTATETSVPIEVPPDPTDSPGT